MNCLDYADAKAPFNADCVQQCAASKQCWCFDRGRIFHRPCRYSSHHYTPAGQRRRITMGPSLTKPTSQCHPRESLSCARPAGHRLGLGAGACRSDLGAGVCRSCADGGLELWRTPETGCGMGSSTSSSSARRDSGLSGGTRHSQGVHATLVSAGRVQGMPCRQRLHTPLCTPSAERVISSRSLLLGLTPPHTHVPTPAKPAAACQLRRADTRCRGAGRDCSRAIHLQSRRRCHRLREWHWCG